MKRALGLTLGTTAMLLLAGAAAPAQTVEVDPLQCWWRTSTGAVRAGEQFSVVLTCSVLDTDAVRVVPDQAALEPSTVQMPPFEVLGGTHHADLRQGDRRFFQYDYRLRVISEDLFGKDAAIPELKITYRVRTQVNGAPQEGIEKSYLLPPLSIRVLSLVPASAGDIRDTTSKTFGDIEATAFRANVLVATGGVLVGLGALLAVVGLIRAAIGRHGTAAAKDSVATDRDVLRGVRGELAKISRERDGGWTPVLASRVLTALRVLAALAASRPAGVRRVNGTGAAGDGVFAFRTGRLRSGAVMVSGYMTPLDVTRALSAEEEAGAGAAKRRAVLESLREPLTVLTDGQYGRQPCDDRQLDGALDAAQHGASLLSREYLWPVQTLRAARRATDEIGQRVWSR